MIKLLLIVIGCYMLAAAVVHLYYVLESRKENKQRHYILLSADEQDHMEWYYRSMKRFSRWMGIPVQVTVVHTQQAGELHQVVDCWNRHFDNIVVQDQLYASVDQAIVIDLNRKDDLCKLPF